ncbi:MAG: replication-associated recombination protein A [Methylomonas sp.]
MFDDIVNDQHSTPLAARMRPTCLKEFIGQQHLLGEGKSLRITIDAGLIHSLVFWGPPGVGKTTLAKIIAKQTKCHFIELSAVMAGVKELRAAVQEAEYMKQHSGVRTIVFVDEIHRFSKSQQDSLLAPMESGIIILFGATTENPSFELNNAVLSRLRVYVLHSIEIDQLRILVNRALCNEQGLASKKIQITPEALDLICKAADGDARRCLTLLEIASDLSRPINNINTINLDVLNEVLQGQTNRYDNKGDIFYEQISALHKSVRGTDPDAALYWFSRMIDGGCDPYYIARRLIRMASEDIGNADPRGLQLAIDATCAFERLGSPEGELALAHATVYLACAPKSNAVYTAFRLSMHDAKSNGSLEVPIHLKNAPTKMMSDLGYGANYRYAHNEKFAYAAEEDYLPKELRGSQYYIPTERGLEKKIKEKLEFLKTLKKEKT